MNKYLYLLSTIFAVCCLSSNAQYKLQLHQGEGYLNVKDTARIDFDIPFSDKHVILVSLDGDLLPADNNYVIHLYNAAGKPVKMYGGWYSKNRMSYFISSGKSQKYRLLVTPDRKNQQYTVRVKLDNVVAPFVKLDSYGNRSDLSTYLISNSPEELKPDSQCMGEKGFYLVRSKLQGNANIYWEHCNDMGYDIKFGILLWNKENKPVKVKINSSSAKSWTGCNGMEGAMCGVWHDWFANKRNDNELADSIVFLPSYNPASPSSSAKWIFMNEVPANDPVKSTFNGLLNVSLMNEDGTLFSGEKLYCDAYAVTPGQEKLVLGNVADNNIAPTVCTLRGSCPGAMILADIPSVKINEDNPYRFLITGFDPPHYQEGENVPTSYFNKEGNQFKLPTHYGYSVVYKFRINKFQSKKPVKAGFRMHPNSYVDQWAGAYVIAKRERDGKVISKQVLITQNDTFVFDPDVPRNEPVVYYIVVSGMSSLPVEIVFSN